VSVSIFSSSERCYLNFSRFDLKLRRLDASMLEQHFPAEEAQSDIFKPSDDIIEGAWKSKLAFKSSPSTSTFRELRQILS